MFMLGFITGGVLENALVSTLFGVLGILILGGGIKFLDIVIERRICFVEELKKNNTAVAIYMAAFILGLAYIIGTVIA
jgi:hypothetical protein